MDYPRLGRGTSQVDEADCEQLLQQRLVEAVRLRLRADVPVCFHLSGGLDSTAVVALAGRHPGRPADRFTVAVEEPVYDQRAQAPQAPDHLGAPPTTVRRRPADMGEHLAD